MIGFGNDSSSLDATLLEISAHLFVASAVGEKHVPSCHSTVLPLSDLSASGQKKEDLRFY